MLKYKSSVYISEEEVSVVFERIKKGECILLPLGGS